MKSFQKPLNLLADLLTGINDEKIMRAVLVDLLTPQEIGEIAERLLIIKNLLHKKAQRAIAQSLNTSIGKVSRGSRVVQFGKADWEEVLSGSKKWWNLFDF